MIPVIRPDWPAPACVQAFSTTRAGGVSVGSYASFNLSNSGADDPAAVAENRTRFRQLLPSSPGWVRQVHAVAVAERGSGTWISGSTESGLALPLDPELQAAPVADAVWTRARGVACTILTADCLPVLFCDRSGNRVAVAHAGWRGLLGGVLAETIAAMTADGERSAGDLLAWLGPGISGRAYAVGPEFKAAFLAHDPRLEQAFSENERGLCADLYAVARMLLKDAGLTSITGGDRCTWSEPECFFSHRRDPRSGRQATVIWLA